jgi:hypothetical protein
MSPEQVDLIRKSFDTMWPMRRDIAELCYGRLFERVLIKLWTTAIALCGIVTYCAGWTSGTFQLPSRISLRGR